jgi:hypothetical protein
MGCADKFVVEPCERPQPITKGQRNIVRLQRDILIDGGGGAVGDAQPAPDKLLKVVSPAVALLATAR